MEIAVTIIMFIVGLVLIVKGGDWFVDAAVWIAKVSGVPNLIVGATVVSLATTLPELLVSINAAIQGKVDMSVGNAVGSVTANIGLIMAIALMFMPMVIRRKDYLLKGAMMISSILIIWLFTVKSSSFTLLPAVILIVIFALFMTDNVTIALREMRGGEREKREKPTRREIVVNIIKFIVGIAAIVVGSNLLVENGSAIARICGVPEGVISVTVIAIGTSLPELVTTLTSIVKKHGDLSVGNIIGANIMDLTMILPVSSLVYGKALPLSRASVLLDFPACLLVGLIALIPALVTKKFSRWQGALLLFEYIAYVLMCTGVISVIN